MSDRVTRRERVLAALEARLREVPDARSAGRFPAVRFLPAPYPAIALISGGERRRSPIEQGADGEGPFGSPMIMRPSVVIVARAARDEDLDGLLNDLMGQVESSLATDPATGRTDESLGGLANYVLSLGCDPPISPDPSEGGQPIGSVEMIIEVGQSRADLDPYGYGF